MENLVALEFSKDGEILYFCIRESDVERFRLCHGHDIAGALNSRAWDAPMGISDELDEAVSDIHFSMCMHGIEPPKQMSVTVVRQH